MTTATTINGYTHALPSGSDAEWGGVLSSFLAGLTYSKRAVFTFSMSSGVLNGVYVYLTPGYAAGSTNELFVPAPFTGKVRAVYFRSRVAEVNFYEVEAMVNGVSMGSVSLGGSTLSGSSAPAGGSIDVAAGDLFSVSTLGATGSVGGVTIDLSVSFCLVPA